LCEAIDSLPEESEIGLSHELMLGFLAVDDIDVIGRQEFHQLHAPFERDDIIFNAVKNPNDKKR
jgi:hypothetical protein